MSRPLLVIFTAVLFLFATACGNVFVRGNFNGASFQGRVSSVQLDVDGPFEITFVTFEQSGGFSTLGFCGNQTSLFPLNLTVNVNFNLGQSCATVLTVLVIL